MSQNKEIENLDDIFLTKDKNKSCLALSVSLKCSTPHR